LIHLLAAQKVKEKNNLLKEYKILKKVLIFERFGGIKRTRAIF